MAFGRIWQHGKYSYGVCRWFAYIFWNFQKWSKIEKRQHFLQQQLLQELIVLQQTLQFQHELFCEIWIQWLFVHSLSKTGVAERWASATPTIVLRATQIFGMARPSVAWAGAVELLIGTLVAIHWQGAMTSSLRPAIPWEGPQQPFFARTRHAMASMIWKHAPSRKESAQCISVLMASC